MKDKNASKVGLGHPRDLLDLLYLPHFEKRNDLSLEDVSKAQRESVHQEIVRSVLISAIIVPTMLVYLIYIALVGYLDNGTIDVYFTMAGVGLLFAAGALYLLYYLLTNKRTLGVGPREAIQFVFYFLVVVSIFLFYVSTKKEPGREGNFSLGYIWFMALAITPATYLVYWAILSGVSLAGAVGTIQSLEPNNDNALQCYILIAIFIVASYFIRSHDFITAYYQNRVTEQNEANSYMASNDQLTGIENRRGMENFVSLNYQSWKEKGSFINIYMFDIDNFKSYNDNFGHAQGDECLKEVANAVQKSFADPNVGFFRYGGDEFIIISEESSSEKAIHLGMNVLYAIHEAKIAAPSETGTPFLTISIGASSKQVTESYSFSRHIAEADKSLYEAKKKNRGSLVFGDKIY